jgi:hypothetical protein
VNIGASGLPGLEHRETWGHPALDKAFALIEGHPSVPGKKRNPSPDEKKE